MGLFTKEVLHFLFFDGTWCLVGYQLRKSVNSHGGGVSDTKLKRCKTMSPFMPDYLKSAAGRFKYWNIEWDISYNGKRPLFTPDLPLFCNRGAENDVYFARKLHLDITRRAWAHYAIGSRVIDDAVLMYMSVSLKVAPRRSIGEIQGNPVMKKL